METGSSNEHGLLSTGTNASALLLTCGTGVMLCLQFNGGSALAANALAGQAFMNIQMLLQLLPC